MCDNDDDAIDKETQTRIHVQPHVFNSENERGLVTCERACQTAVSSFPDVEDKVFFSLLEFIPYKDIDIGAKRILDLPRKQRLQFRLPSGDEEESDSSATSEVSNVSSTNKPLPKKALKKRFSADSIISEEAVTIECDVQTTLSVVPHILDENEVAEVFDETSHAIVTSFVEEETVTIGTISSASDICRDTVSELVGKIREICKARQSKCNVYVVCTSDGNQLFNGKECLCESCGSSCTDDEENKNIFCGCDLSDLNSMKTALQSLLWRSDTTGRFHSEKEVQTYQEYFTASISVQTEKYEHFAEIQTYFLTEVAVQTDAYDNYIKSTSSSKTNSSNLQSLQLAINDLTIPESKPFSSANVSELGTLKDTSSAERAVIRLPMINSIAFIIDKSFISQIERSSLIPRGARSETPSSHAAEELTLETMSSKIPVPLNRKSNCPSKLALCQQGAAAAPATQNPCENVKDNKNDTGANETKNENGEGGKRIICKIKIKTGGDKDDKKAEGEAEDTSRKKNVSLNTEDGRGDKKAIEAPKAEEPEKVLQCCCKKEEDKPKPKPFVPLSELENFYFEHYVEELQSSTTGVQTELDNGSDSVDSLPGLPESEWCVKGAELPWQKFVLSSPGTYTIRSTKKEVSTH